MTTTFHRRASFPLVLCALAFATAASGQPIVPRHSLRGALDDLGTRVNTTIASGLGLPDVILVPELRGQISTLATLASLEVSTAPLGTASGGFTYTFDPGTGTFVRSSDSFGPSFSRRSLTGGRARASWGVNWLHAGYDTLAGLSLHNGDLRIAQHASRLAVSTQEPDLPVDHTSLTLDLSSDTFVGFAMYGVARDLDVSIAVPIVRVALAGDVAFVDPAGRDITPGGHLLTLPRMSATGVGDIALTAKYRVWRQAAGGAAVEVTGRLPTGDVNELRGTGVTRTAVSGIWSGAVGRLAAHATGGYEVWAQEVSITEGGTIAVRNQVLYSGGVEIVPHRRATINLELVGRRLLGGGRPAYQPLTTGPARVDVLLPSARGIDVLGFAPGVKWNVAGTVVVTASALAPVANQGLRARVSPAVGLDWSF
jgi:hypothetical protein